MANIDFQNIGSGGGQVLTIGGATQIPFVNGTADDFSYSSDLVWDNVNSRLGIGVIPTQTLSVNGNIAVGQNNQYLINNNNVGIGRDSNDLYLGGYNSILFRSSNTSIGLQTNRMIITSSGNVGINQLTPTARLEVKGEGTTSATTAFLVQNSVSANLLSVLDNGITQFGNFTRGAGVLSTDYIITNGRIRAAGGICFYTPTAADPQKTGFTLENSKIVTYIGNTSVASFGGSGASTENVLQLQTSFNPSTGATDKNYLIVSPTIDTGAGYSGDTYAVRILHNLNTKLGTGKDYGIYQSSTHDTILNYFQGAVGIGTNLPTAKLQVVGLANYANNAAAITAGLTAGAMYIRAGHGLDIVI